MKRPIRSEAMLVPAAALAALLLCEPALAQSATMPLPGGASSMPNLTVDPGLWSLTPGESHRAVLTFDHYPTAIDVAALDASGLHAHAYRTLPMIAVRGTGMQLLGLLGLPGLRSIYFDRSLGDLPDQREGVASMRARLAKSVGIAPDGTAKMVTVAVIDSRGTVVTALAGFDWVFQNRLKLGIEMISNGWAASGELAPDDPMSVATKVARDAGLIVVFAAENDMRGEPR